MASPQEKKAIRITKWMFILFLDVIFAVIILFIYSYLHSKNINTIVYIISAFIIYISIRFLLFFFNDRQFNKQIELIKDAVSEYKKGRFVLSRKKIDGNDELSGLYKEIVVMGRHFENILSSQKEEIDKFHDLYDNIVFSISSYFLVLDEEEKILFANEGFCRKFQFQQNELSRKKINEIFYFINDMIKSGMATNIYEGKPVILEKIHLLSLTRVSIIADIKISNVIIQGKRQIIINFDDVTNKLREDYRITLMSQISESIQSDVKIEKMLHTVLTGVTSGSGLGFNRAMLLLLDRSGEFLEGRMAVGPDSFEEAIQIWSSISASGHSDEDNDFLHKERGRKFMQLVVDARFPVSEDNVFSQAIKTKKSIHIYDAWDKDLVPEDIKKFIDAREFIVVPLVAANRAVGIIIADNKFNQIPIGNDSKELLSIFASQAALSIESYNNLEGVKTEMQKLGERQEAIVESEKMAAVGRIAAHIAHEIRNPLVTMGGYARRISQLSKDPKNSFKISNAAEIILKESERLEKTLSNVMDFTKPTKHIMEFNNINDVVNDTLALLKNVLLEKQIEVRLNLNPDIPLVKSDFNQLKQVFLNLLQNSDDASSSGGYIEISTSISNNYLIIIIKDNGSGISESDPEIIFEPFFTTKVTGVGLGLANVKKIIKDHGGEITARNRKTGGAEFKIKLPVPA